MAELRVPLPKGSTYGERTATHGVLREVSTADMIGAGEDAEKCVLGPDGAFHLVQSPTLSGVHLLRRQIKRLEDAAGTVIDGPLDLAMFLKLEPQDFVELQKKAEELDKAAAQAVEQAAERGRGHPAS